MKYKLKSATSQLKFRLISYFYNMKSFIILIALFFCIQTSFAQRDSAMLARSYNSNLQFWTRMSKSLNERYEIEFCNCDKNDPTIYFYRVASMQPLTDSLGNDYPYHEIYVIEQTLKSWKATIHENLKSRVASPKSGWLNFNQVLDSIDIKTLPKDFLEIEYTVLASPDGMMNMLRVCENGAPKIYNLLGKLQFITQYGMDMDIYRRSGQQVMRIRRLLELFPSELAP